MDLYLLRHGKAGTADHDNPLDSQRHLTQKGRDGITQLGNWMRYKELTFSLIATSPLPRAVETATIIAGILDAANNVHEWDELTPSSDPKTIIRKIVEIKDEGAVLLVGHEPQLSMLASLIICNKPGCGIILKKGGLARIRFHGELGSGELLWLLTPGFMRKEPD